MNPAGFTPADWRTVKVFAGRCAEPRDVDAALAVFALGDTYNGQPFEEPLPQPVIWYEADEEFAALIVQAEAHETEDGERLEVLGLLLPNGQTKVAFTDDVEEVAGADPVWLALIQAQHDADFLDGDDGDGVLDDVELEDEV